MVIHESYKSIIKLTENNTVVKTLKTSSVDEEWLAAYNALTENDDRFVKVIKIINNSTYEMEYLDEPCITVEDIIKNPINYHRLAKNDIINITALLPELFVKTLELSKQLPGNKYFIHGDMLLPNFLFTDSKKIKIIDPDGFCFVENLDYVEKYYMSSINVMYNIQKIFSHIGQ
jgi:thiamine kinase-like enzyme